MPTTTYSIRGLIGSIAFALLVSVSNSQAATQGSDIFMKFESIDSKTIIQGESADGTFKGKDGYFQLNSVDVSFENELSTSGATTGAGAGKAKFLDLNIKKTLDSTSPNVFVLLATGQHLKTATIVFRKTGSSSGQPYLTLTFQNVFITSQQWSADSSDPTTNETLKLSYTAVQATYHMTSSTGKLSPPFTGSWDNTINAPAVGL